MTTPFEEATTTGAPDAPRLRVLYVTPRYPPDVGGVERHVWEVARRVARRGCDVTVLCTDRTGARVGTQCSDGVRVRRVRAWSRRRDYYFAPGVWRAMRRERFDIVHVQSYHTFVAPIAMLSAIHTVTPFVLTFHGGGHSSRRRHELRHLQRRALGPLLRRAARLIAVARFEISDYGNELRMPADRFVLIPNGLDVPSVAPTSVSEGGTVLATIGRLERYKGHHRVIEAMPYLLEQMPDAMLWVVGVGPDADRLRARARELRVDDHVEFRSVPSDDPQAMIELTRRTDIVVNLSDFETHPISALEAAAAGRRLLVADTSGLRELAQTGLASAIELDATPRHIAEAIVRELERPLPTRAPELPTWDDCADRLVALYQEVVCAS
ncbi:MAG TPA: glycosyltransferase family 4 protein [Acidimicrobiia bacterium]|nr:glycosyltransferase family 4 protein [Acidimicrobiia bacterium]